MEIAAGGKRKRVSASWGVGVMIREIYQNYHLPMMPHAMTLAEIRFWYDPMIPSLCEMQRAAKRSKET